MPELPSPSPRGPSPLWVLAVLPVGLLIGWGVAQLPGPKLKPTEAAAPVAVARPADTEPQGARVHPGAVEPAKPAEAAKPQLSQWTTDIDAAFIESKHTGKPMLIDFNADWCGPCRAMHQQVFMDGTLGPQIQMAVIPVAVVDRTREDGRNPEAIEKIMQQFQVDAFPTLVVISPVTGKALRTQGYNGPEATATWILDSAKRVR